MCSESLVSLELLAPWRLQNRVQIKIIVGLLFVTVTGGEREGERKGERAVGTPLASSRVARCALEGQVPCAI